MILLLKHVEFGIKAQVLFNKLFLISNQQIHSNHKELTILRNHYDFSFNQGTI